jgi:hypothetical protein
MAGTRKILAGFSQTARQSAAIKVVMDALDQAGEDPVLLARLLREADSLQVLHPTAASTAPRTAAQKTGFQSMAALERKLGQRSPDVAAHVKNAADENLEAIRRLMDHMVRTGDPEAIKYAAKMRKVYFKTLVKNRLNRAEDAARDMAARITEDTPGARAELSKKASVLIDDAIKDVRAAETELWNAVPDGISANTENLKANFTHWWDELLPEVRGKRLPDAVSSFLKRTEKAGKGTTVKELRQLRSELLEQARKFSREGEHLNAKVAGEMAEAVLDDLDGAFAGDPAYDAARKFSWELNKTFTRSFIGKATAQTKYGARMPPELMMKKALATGKEAAALQLQELENATTFMVRHAKDADTLLLSKERVQDMLSIQERLIRLAAQATVPIDPKTGIPGKVSVRTLGKFIEDNSELMRRFPEVKADLEKALTSEVARARIEAVTKGRALLVEQKSAFSKLAKGDPIRVMERTLRSSTMERELKTLIKVAKRDGSREAMNGLRASVLEAAMRKTTNRSGVLSLPEFRAALFDPPVPGGKSVIEVLGEMGAIDSTSVKLMNKVLQDADKIFVSQHPKMAVEKIEDAPGILYDLLTRVVGAATAGKLARVSGSEAHGLIVAHGGSKAAQAIVQKLPNVKIQAILSDLLLNDHETLARLIEKTPTAAKQLEAARFLHGYLFQIGAYGATEYVHPQPESPEISEAALSVM